MNNVTQARVRLAIRLLIAAAEQDKELLVDQCWQKAMQAATKLHAKLGHETMIRPHVMKDCHHD